MQILSVHTLVAAVLSAAPRGRTACSHEPTDHGRSWHVQVLSGHVHSYERSLPMYNYSVNPCGVQYITVGKCTLRLLRGCVGRRLLAAAVGELQGRPGTPVT